MGKIKVKINKSKLPDEFIFHSYCINNEEDLNTELGWSEIMDAIIDRLVIGKEFIGDIEKQCPEEGNNKIRCIDCSCNLCIHSCTKCDIVDCEPKKIT